MSEGIRAMLHHDVDVIGIGEIRDAESAKSLMEAGFAGAHTLTTVQSNDAIKTIFKLQNFGLKKEDIALVVNGIVAQKFVRRVCPECVESYKPDRNTLELAGLLRLPSNVQLYHGKGCSACLNSGFVGRLPIFETLVINEELSSHIHAGSSYVEIKKVAEKTGFTTMRYDGLRKALAGLTTLDEVIRVT
jgi:general secretion pathway protein E